jgi:hypothetical protein
MTRIAQCCCGSLRAEASGEPVLVHVCHCTQCQRRTGSVFSVGSFFPKSQVHIQGPSKLYVRDGQESRKVRTHFCPDCGTTVYGEADARPGLIAIFVGAFGDPNFPAPTRSIWEQSRHSWAGFNQEVGQEVGHFAQAASTVASS